MRFYTNIVRRGNNFLLRGYENGKRFNRKVAYKPHLFVSAKKPDGDWKTLDGQPLIRMDFEDMKAARDFSDRYGDLGNAKVYGLTQYEYVYLNENYPGQIAYDPALIEVVNIDIEIDNEGLSMPETMAQAVSEVNAITMRHRGTAYQFGCGDYIPKADHIIYYKCDTEAQLLSRFLRLYEKIAPDVITGWNIEGFDMIYLARRINNLLGANYTKKLSPWGIVQEREKKDYKTGNDYPIVNLAGVTQLDYMILYKKFTYTQQESYSLNWIAHVELDKAKLDYSQYQSLYGLSRENFPLFMEYNDVDTALVEELDAKMGFLNQVYAIAYDAHVNFEDALTSVRLWDIIVYRKLASQNVAVPPKKNTEKTEQIEGAYVKEPVPGRYRWVMSFDLDSLYPHLIMGTNISPETLSSADKLPLTVEDIINGKLETQGFPILKDDVAVAGTGYMFKRNVKGFLPELMFEYYNDRKVFKKKMLAAEQGIEDIEAEMRRRGMEIPK